MWGRESLLTKTEKGHNNAQSNLEELGLGWIVDYARSCKPVDEIPPCELNSILKLFASPDMAQALISKALYKVNSQFAANLNYRLYETEC